MSLLNNILRVVRTGAIATREDLISICSKTSRLTIERDALKLKRDERLLVIAEECDPEIETLETEIDHNVRMIKAWSDKHRKDEFGGKQGIMVAGCALEYRKGTGKVVCDKSDKDAVADVLALPDENLPQIKALTKIDVKLNRGAVKALASSKEGRELLEFLGIRIVVEEVFSFTPARDDLAPMKITVPSAA